MNGRGAYSLNASCSWPLAYKHQIKMNEKRSSSTRSWNTCCPVGLPWKKCFEFSLWSFKSMKACDDGRWWLHYNRKRWVRNEWNGGAPTSHHLIRNQKSESDGGSIEMGMEHGGRMWWDGVERRNETTDKMTHDECLWRKMMTKRWTLDETERC